MRCLCLSLLVFVSLSVSRIPVRADNGMQSRDQMTVISPSYTSTQTAVIPVGRYYTNYNDDPGWHNTRYYSRYRPYYYEYSVRPYVYRPYGYPAPVYRYNYYAPFDFYYSGPRVRFGFGF